MTFWASGSRQDLHIRVWAPKGVEVFLRPPFPCVSPIKEDKASEDVEGEMSGKLLFSLSILFINPVASAIDLQ